MFQIKMRLKYKRTLTANFSNKFQNKSQQSPGLYGLGSIPGIFQARKVPQLNLRIFQGE